MMNVNRSSSIWLNEKKSYFVSFDEKNSKCSLDLKIIQNMSGEINLTTYQNINSLIFKANPDVTENLVIQFSIFFLVFFLNSIL